MKNKMKILLPLLILAILLISGCVTSPTSTPTPTVTTPASGFIPQTGLPVGFTYMGTHTTTVDINGTSINATEIIYKYNSTDDVYIQLLRNTNPQELLVQYKSKYKSANYNPFEEVSFNGHNATKVKDYTVKNAAQVAYYSIVWASGSSMIIVGPSQNADAILLLATSTGH